jgi:hypothetical protein
MKTKIKRSIRQFKRWLDKPNRTFISPYEADMIKFFRKIIYSEDSDCFVDLNLNKRYIENSFKNVFVILSDKNITIINGKNKLSQNLCNHSYDVLCDIFDTRLSFIRSIKESEYLEDTIDFLDKLNLKFRI